jgi:hypothetical protein
MDKVLHVRHPRWNRRKLFEGGGLRLWLKPVGMWGGPVTGVRLELLRSSPGKPSKWRILWSGRLTITQDSVEVERKQLGERRA